MLLDGRSWRVRLWKPARLVKHRLNIDPNVSEAWNNNGIALEVPGRTAEDNAAIAKAKELGYEGLK
jgi:hypothetical protein